jgi:hypothetical protein
MDTNMDTNESTWSSPEVEQNYQELEKHYKPLHDYLHEKTGQEIFWDSGLMAVHLTPKVILGFFISDDAAKPFPIHLQYSSHEDPGPFDMLRDLHNLEEAKLAFDVAWFLFNYNPDEVEVGDATAEMRAQANARDYPPRCAGGL